MASRKVADAHVQFSAEGIPELARAVKSVENDLSRLSATSGRGGLFGNNFARDIAQLDKVQRELKKNIQLKNQLMATEVQASFAADRTLASRAAQDRSRGRIAQAGVRQVMASPALQQAQKQSSTLDFQELVKQRSELKRFIGTTKAPVSDEFKARASTVGNQIFDQNPTALRQSASEIRDALNSISRFGPKGSKTKTAVDEVKRRMEEMAGSAIALADRMENLDQIIKKGAALTPEQRGRIRGNTRDELRSGERVDAITQRQAAREEQSVSGRTLLNRRFREIAETPDLTDRQKSNERALAAKEVAVTLRNLAQDIRESKIDEALQSAANRLREGKITPEAFRSEITRAEAQQVGAASAGSIAEDVNFRSKTGGASKGTVAMRQEAETLRNSKEEIDKLVAANSNLTAEEKKRLQVESELLAAEIKSSESRASISEEMDKLQAGIKKSMEIERDFQERVEKGEKLSKKDTAARKANKKTIDQQARAHEELNKKLGGFNNDMRAAAGSSRRFNFMIQQVSFGVQDFVQVIGQTGLSGALRASANNMASVAAATGKLGGALTGALGTVAMIGFAQVLESMGEGAETAEEKIDRLLKRINKFSELRTSSRGFASDIAEQALGKGDFSVGLGAKARGDGSEAVDEAKSIKRSMDTTAHEISNASKLANNNTILMNREVLAAMKISGFSKDEIEKAKREALSNFRAKQTSFTALGSGPAGEKLASLATDRYSKSLDEISKAQANSAQDLAMLALILDPANKKIKDQLESYTASIEALEVTAGRSKASFDKMNESLEVFERDASERAKFSDSALPDAADQIASRLSESASRLRKLNEDLASAPKESEEESFRKELVEQEKKVFDRYLQSLESINGQIDTASSPSSGIAKSIGDLISEFASSRADLKASLESAPASDRDRILAQSDQAKSRDLSAAVKSAVSGFSGEVEKTLGETQSQANSRMRADLFAFIKALKSSESTADDALIPAIQSAIEKIGGSGSDSVAVTSIAGLHQKIQESLVSDPAITLQEKGNEILKRIEANTGLTKKESEGVADRMRSLKEDRGAFAEADAGLMSVPPPQFSQGVISRKPTDQTENSTERSNNLRRINQKNQQARAGRNIFTGKPTEDSMSAAQSQVQRSGYSDLLRKGGQNNESFFGARRGGTVSDSPAQRRGVVDDSSTFGRRFSGSSSAVPTSAAEDARALQGSIPGESPEENRRRRVAERNAVFGARPDAGPELNSRTVKTAIAAMPVAESRRAGPVATSEEAARFRAEREAKAGPRLTAGNVRGAMAPINPGRFASAGRAEESGPGRFAIDQASRDAAAAGIPLSVPDQGQSRRGIRSQMRRDRITSGAARREREARDEKDRLERYEDRIKSAREAEEAKADALAGRKSGLSAGQVRSRKRRKDEGRDPSFMQKFEAGEFDQGKPDTPVNIVPTPEMGMQSNVNTDANKQITKATDEALQYHKNTSARMDQLVELIKTRSTSGGLVIS